VHRYEDLEKKWFGYRLKRLFVFYAAPVLVVVIGVAGYFYFLYSSANKKETPAVVEKTVQQPVQKEVVAETEVIVESNITLPQKEDINGSEDTLVQKSDENTTEPEVAEKPKSLEGKKCYKVVVEILNIRSEPSTSATVLGKYNYGDIVCQNERAGDWLLSDKGWIFAKNFVEPLPESYKPIEAPRSELSPLSTPQETLIPRIEINMNDAPKKPSISMSSKPISDMQKVELYKQEFNSSPSYENAIKIAEAYFDIGSYEDSRDWALVANEKSANAPGGWILFAKSLYKMGKKGEAVAVLESYLKRNDSAEVKAALKSLED